MNKNGREIRDEDMSAADRKTKRTLIAFERNAKVADSNRKRYGGKFIAVSKQEVIGDDPNLDSLLQKIGDKSIDPEVFIGYISKDKEMFLNMCPI